jgi:hypothetical protein
MGLNLRPRPPRSDGFGTRFTVFSHIGNPYVSGMSWIQSFLVAILAVALVFYVARTVILRRAENPAWTRWAWVSGLFALALVLNVVALVLSA